MHACDYIANYSVIARVVYEMFVRRNRISAYELQRVRVFCKARLKFFFVYAALFQHLCLAYKAKNWIFLSFFLSNRVFKFTRTTAFRHVRQLVFSLKNLLHLDTENGQDEKEGKKVHRFSALL